MRAAKAAAAVERTEDKEIDLLLSEIPHVTSPQGRQRGVGVIGDGNGNGVHGASGSDGYTSPMRIGCRRVHCPTGADGYDAQRHGKDAYYDMVLNRRDNGAPLHGGDAGGVGFPAPSPPSGPFVGSPMPPPPPLALGVGVDDQEQQLIANQLRGLRIGDAQDALQRQGPPPVIHTAPTEVPAAHGAYDGYNFAASGSSVRHEHVFLDQAKPVGYVAARPHRFVSDVGLDDFGGFPRALDTSIGGFMYNRVGHGTGIGWGQGLVQPDFAESYLLSSQAGAEFSSSSPVALKRHYAYGGVPVAANGFARGRNQFDALSCDNSPSEVGAEFFSSSPAALDFRGGPKRHYAYGGVSVADNGFARGRNQFEAFHCDNSLMFDGKNMNFLERERETRFQRVNSRALEFGSSRTMRFDNVVRVKEGSIYHMAKDQNGCRYLQDKFLEGKHHVDAIFEGIINHIADLMISSFGNYLVQKMLEVCDEGQRLRIILVLTQDPVKQLIAISLNTHGTRVVQRLIETVRSRDQIMLIISALQPNFMLLVNDPNGNHVIQKCLTNFGAEDNKFIFEGAAANCFNMAVHRHGCCVLQRCISNARGVYQANLIVEICARGFELAQDPFGNYVVQYVLELKIPSANAHLASQFEGKYIYLSKQKVSSNVVERCLKFFPDDAKAVIVHELLLLSGSHFEQLLQDPYANYVIYTALLHTKGHLHNALVEAIRPHEDAIRTSPCCKRICRALSRR
ncbi:putative pumilio homolog 7, chloroplastic [Miscanthus floridulus]|uniref:putative pumilio homolog 7, chloroplastic n=1 Tax=Miscanthus floridulus TaxID=154761 RepID=UPI00345A65F2